jgi:phosphoribosyl 1,2-cyclic phosphodiesterase
MDLSLCSLVSGSIGNCTYVAGGNTRLLVDAGTSAKRITERLCNLGIPAEELNGILVTHEHTDHIQGVGVLARRYNIPIYATHGTWEAMYDKIGNIEKHQIRVISADDDFYIDDIAVSPFAISHDANEPVAFRLYYNARSVSVATDLGHACKKVKSRLSGSDFLLFESNHDPTLLENNSRYPAVLKKRISGRKGHLSNEACAMCLMDLLETGVKNVMLGHLSQQNNTPELALSTVSDVLESKGVVVGKDVSISIADPEISSSLYLIR